MAKQAMENMQKNMKMPGGGSRLIGAAKVLAGAAAIGFTGYHSLFTVDGGHRAVIYSRFSGIKQEVKGEGTHFLLPWFERANIFDVRTKPRTLQSLTGSNDLQMVNINLRILSKPEASRLPFIYQRLGTDYDERVLPSIVNEVLKTVVARYKAVELLTKRAEVSVKIKEMLTDRARDFQINLEDVSIIDLTFGREFTAAVEAKQVAQQDAQRARFIVQRAQQDKKSAIIRAEGEAKSAELIGDAVQENPAFIELRRIEAARDIASTLSHGGNRLFLNADALLLNLLEDSGSEARMAAVSEVDSSAKKGWY